MYAALWRKLPGPLWARIVTAVSLVAIVIVVLMVFVFPIVDAWMASNPAVN